MLWKLLTVINNLSQVIEFPKVNVGCSLQLIKISRSNFCSVELLISFAASQHFSTSTLSRLVSDLLLTVTPPCCSWSIASSVNPTKWNYSRFTIFFCGIKNFNSVFTSKMTLFWRLLVSIVKYTYLSRKDKQKPEQPRQTIVCWLTYPLLFQVDQ